MTTPDFPQTIHTKKIPLASFNFPPTHHLALDLCCAPFDRLKTLDLSPLSLSPVNLGLLTRS
jgi:hypothetical protein